MQDLAVSPGIQDPTLNTAECVIQGHQPKIDAKGLSSYTRAILWCSFLSVLLLGPIIALFSLDFFGNDPKKEDFVCCAKQAPDNHTEECLRCINDFVCYTKQAPANHREGCLICSYKHCCCDRFVVCDKNENPLIRSAKLVCYLLLLTEIGMIIFVVKSVTYKNIPSEICKFYIVLMMGEGIFISIIRCLVQCCKKGCENRYIVQCYRWLVFITCANIISYHFCWLIVGIMINPTWGLTVLAVVCFVSVALFFSVYFICDADKDSFIQRFFMFAVAFVGLCFVASLTVLAGRSFYGKDTADEIVKTALLYVVGGITWLFRKGSAPNQANQVDQNNQANQVNQNNQANQVNQVNQNNQAIDPSNQGEPDSDPESTRSSSHADNGIELQVRGERGSSETDPFVPQG